MDRTEWSSDDSVISTPTKGRRGGVAGLLTFAPITDIFHQTTHYLQSDDTHPETSTFVPLDLMDDVFQSVKEFGDLDDSDGWWGISQSSGAWFGRGLAKFRDQFQRDHSSLPHITSTHHHGAAMWIAPLNSIRGIEAVAIAGGPSSYPGEGKTLKQSVRRPTVTLLLSSEWPSSLARASREINMPFFQERGNPNSGTTGGAEHREWKNQYFILETDQLPDDQRPIAQFLGMSEKGEIETTNPYYRNPVDLAQDYTAERTEYTSSLQNDMHRFASYERIQSHIKPNNESALRNFSPGDHLKVKSIEITSLPGCAVTFSPTNAEVIVSST